ncbi:MAG: class I SAM-dependent methyltransferase [Actinomycetota bacterium]|nr:class I SAM-dependent methyltransferase [Actinomycetota bacterium]
MTDQQGEIRQYQRADPTQTVVGSFLLRRSRRIQLKGWPVYMACADAFDVVLGRRSDLIPSRRQLLRNFIGGADYEQVGEEFFGYFVDLGGLQPHHAVLDIGCGFGRMAVPLTRYLSGEGSYCGFDINPAGIEWSRDHITRRYPNFQFRTAESRNPLYNRSGDIDAASYRFPYDDHSFDFVMATSVFTHMFQDEISQYLRETARVLRPGGTCLLTYFVLNGESREAMAAGKGSLVFHDAGGGVWTIDGANPARALAYDERAVRDDIERAGLEIVEPIRWGSWSGRANGLSLQDMVIARAADEDRH